MKQEETRQRLIDGTIRVIAREGMDKATTKQIGLETNINEAYIYRCFADKEDMFAKAFASLDNELEREIDKRLPILSMPDLSNRERARILYGFLWRFLLGKKDKCKCYIQYYHSPYFNKYSAKEHSARYQPLVDRFTAAFKEEAKVKMLLNFSLNTMLLFALKVFDGLIPDDDDTEEHVFRVIYGSIQQYFKETGENVGEQ